MAKIDSFKVQPWDQRRDLLIPGDEAATINVRVRHFMTCCRRAIEQHGNFFVALAGGSTPKAVYTALTSYPFSEKILWEKVWLFWSDERNVSPVSNESNYKMAMEAGFEKMPIPKEQIFRMPADQNLEENALIYEQNLRLILPYRSFDLVILGMGEDGHTASLFPQTQGLKSKERLVIANFVPQKNSWRMTLTFDAINQSQNIVIYVLGSNKKFILNEVFNSKEQFECYPVQRIGTKEHRALWILDIAAAANLLK